MKKTIIQLRDLIFSHETEITPDIEEAIDCTVLGNPGGIQYSHVGAIQKARSIKPLHFFPLRRNNKLMLVMALAERVTQCNGFEYPTYYVRYVSFHPNYTITTLNQNNTSDKLQQLGNSIIKKGMLEYANEIPFSLPLSKPSDKKIFYAYVEESNLRSMQFTQFFFKQIRTISVTTFSRLMPNKHAGFEPLAKTDQPKMFQMLNKQYGQHSFYYLGENELTDKYYVIKQSGEIVAGVKAGKEQWKIKYLPGYMGKIILKVIPSIPILKRIFPEGLFTYLTLDTVYCKPGNEHHLSNLFESVCAQNKIYAAMLYIDIKDPIYSLIQSIKNKGILNALFKEAKVALVARFINLTDDEQQNFQNRPAYVSGFDLS